MALKEEEEEEEEERRGGINQPALSNYLQPDELLTPRDICLGHM